MSHSLIRAVADILTADYRDMKASVAYIDATGIGSRGSAEYAAQQVYRGWYQGC